MKHILVESMLVGALCLAVTLATSKATAEEPCHLLSIAYNEQDELAPQWYVDTAKYLRDECGYTVSDHPAAK